MCCHNQGNGSSEHGYSNPGLAVTSLTMKIAGDNKIIGYRSKLN